MIKVFHIEDIVYNVDNEEDAQKLIDQGASLIDASIFGEYANWATSDNTKKVDGVWTFTPDMAAINNSIEESKELELDMKLTELVGTNPQDKIAKLQELTSFNSVDRSKKESVASRYLKKLQKEHSKIESELAEFL